MKFCTHTIAIAGLLGSGFIASSSAIAEVSDKQGPPSWDTISEVTPLVIDEFREPQLIPQSTSLSEPIPSRSFPERVAERNGFSS